MISSFEFAKRLFSTIRKTAFGISYYAAIIRGT